MNPEAAEVPGGEPGAGAVPPQPGEEVEIVRSPTEERSWLGRDIDQVATIDVLRRINVEDAGVAGAVAQVLPELARAVDMGVAALRGGGRIHYFGAGTSGRIAVMDAAELPPTFGLAEGRVVAHHAGGELAFGQALEGAEDDERRGRADAASLVAGDVAVGVTASGRTPYVAGALRHARRQHAAAVLVSANPRAELAEEADVHVGADTGAEVIAGSTRMKAGTAQKLILNGFSTAVMVRLGYTYSNLMVGVNATNAKLRGRVVTILTEATGLEAGVCEAALAAAGGDTRVALVSLLAGVEIPTAASAVGEAEGSVREALRLLGTG
ncbi:N-acetylmuramic acid 6-phosphate etherase [Salinactinospora qingdaonensis]|uniref:N-acetylmuramic acid 6-phosphate etherase n=1 Tax=Salinactinospora qingdaonensis TaxID=702744 RepID=A0ABP7F277_9ACTN